jgi:protein XagA
MRWGNTAGWATFMVTLAAFNNAYAGAWTAEKGGSYNKLSVNYYRSDSAFGPQPGFEEFEDINITYYGEYGIRNDLTVFGSIPFRRIENTSFGQTAVNGGIGDVEVGLRYRLVEKPFVASAQVIFKAPYLYNRNNALPLGNGQEDIELRLLGGKSLGRFGYVGAEVGYRFRFEAPSDEFRYLIEYGVDVNKAIYLRSKLDAIVAIDSTSSAPNVLGGNPQVPLAFNLGRVETTAGWRINKRFAAEFTATTNPFGDNIIRGTTYQFALVASF